ncbi:DUF4269 domain-containing protein [Salirhabdus sp. Marseille-P4669]|uniref:DUF4269 domain-containing protein n=1 Tax=Salirhabdus sp. Marseille-P4669 TaxID=2042310 RepID=UPI000C7BCA27|nr:DUF4269 domain-containing protein [Salirhabdus sp. Marseille-P4669]
MFDSLGVLRTGNPRQQLAYENIIKLNILKDFKDYNPTLCGTIPLNIDVENSDLDIIMEAYHLNAFKEKIIRRYGHLSKFRITEKVIRERKVVKANFLYGGFEFELFGQPQPVCEQNAYLHMVIENALLKVDSSMRQKVRDLKRKGYKTEPAFCKLLNIPGDPYDEFIQFAKKEGLLLD